MNRRKGSNDAKKFIDDLFDELHQDYTSIELTDSELKSIIYGNAVNLHTTSDKRRCSVKHCRHDAVMSHLFQESVLKKIATNGHLLSPSFNINKRKIELKRIGVNKALTFTGFCATHENMFEYERNEKVSQDNELRTLVYKAVCYNHVFWDIAYKKMKTGFDEIIERKQNKFEKVAQDKYSILGTLGFNLKSFKVSDYHQSRFRVLLKERKKLVLDAFNFKQQIWSDIKTSKNENLKSYVIEIDVMVPICFSYFGNLTMKNKGKYFNELACFIIHPFKNHTKLIFTSSSKNYNKLKDILSNLKSEESPWFILSSLIYVSDNWLINPDFYSEYCPPEFKELIENAEKLPLSNTG